MSVHNSNVNTSSMYLSGNAESGKGIEVVALDEYAEQHGIRKTNFIKADIEGAEWDMLHGAEKIIRRDKPLMAISIYHSALDFFRIPLYLKTLVPEYRFKARHHSVTYSETILYCYV